MTTLFHVDILTPRGAVYRGDVSALVVPAEFGYLGVLAGHAPLAAKLKKGDVSLTAAGGNKGFRSSGSGFMEVLNNKVTIIMDEVIAL